MSASPVSIPKAVEKKLPDCEAYVESLSLSPEQRQMFAQAAKNRLSTTPKIFRGRRATLEAMAMASTSPLQQQGGMHAAASVPTFYPSPTTSMMSLQSAYPLVNPSQQQRQQQQNAFSRQSTEAPAGQAPPPVQSHVTPQSGFS